MDTKSGTLVYLETGVAMIFDPRRQRCRASKWVERDSTGLRSVTARRNTLMNLAPTLCRYQMSARISVDSPSVISLKLFLSPPHIPSYIPQQKRVRALSSTFVRGKSTTGPKAAVVLNRKQRRKCCRSP